MTIITTVSSVALDTIEPSQGFARVRVENIDANDLLKEVILQLRLVSLKLDCLQPGDEEIDEIEFDLEDL